jgi:hypothetical protein
MNDESNDLEQPEEDILTYTVSDEALEAAAQTEKGRMTRFMGCSFSNCPRH